MACNGQNASSCDSLITTATTKPYLKTLYIRQPQSALQLNNYKKQAKIYKQEYVKETDLQTETCLFTCKDEIHLLVQNIVYRPLSSDEETLVSHIIIEDIYNHFLVDTIWSEKIFRKYDIWYDMIWYDMIWYDMIWYDMIWYDMI